MTDATPDFDGRLSVVVPVRDERENVATLHALCYRAIGRPPLVKQSDWNKAYPAYALSGDDMAPDDDSADGRTSDGPGDEVWNEINLLRVRMIAPLARRFRSRRNMRLSRRRRFMRRRLRITSARLTCFF